MKVYVAAKFEQKTRATAMMTILKALGHEITFDWTIHDEDEDEIEAMSLIERRRYLEKWARQDLRGVVEADILILLAHPKGKGQYTEFGVALALDKPVIVVAHHEVTNVFFNLDAVLVVESDSEAIYRLNAIPKPATMAKAVAS